MGVTIRVGQVTNFIKPFSGLIVDYNVPTPVDNDGYFLCEKLLQNNSFFVQDLNESMDKCVML